MIEKDADPIKCEIVTQLGTEVLSLQNHALAAEGRAWILAVVLLRLPRCNKIAKWKAMGECNMQIALVGTMGMRVTVR